MMLSLLPTLRLDETTPYSDDNILLGAQDDNHDKNTGGRLRNAVVP
ncbi:hypothetical protein [Rahnella woolbedingensis]|nr:hypothetical protein [Rahnella woolbedingensis]